jgi:hypothetical protein
MKNVQVSLDDLLADLDSAFAEAMKKSEDLSKGFGDDQEAPADQAAAAPAPAAPAAPAPAADAGAQAPAAAGAEDQSSAQEAPEAGEGMADESEGQEQQEPGQEQQEPGQEGQDPAQDQNLSDEELQQVYSSMAPEELERHYMVIRGLLQQQYSKAEKAPEANGGQIKAGMAKEEKGSKEEMDKCGEMSSPAMKKSETNGLAKEVADLKKSNDELKAGLDKALQAVKILAQPVRKAITSEIQYISKSEAPVAQAAAQPNFAEMSDEALKASLNDVCRSGALNKSERDLVNNYILNYAGKDKVIEILRSKK